MISTSGPPLPMQLQVPPGHLIQQIVDENGILTHLIISPYNPNMQIKLNDRLYFNEDNESQNIENPSSKTNESLTLNTNMEMDPKSPNQNGNHVYEYNGYDDDNGPYYHANSSGRLRNGKTRHSAHSDIYNSEQNPNDRYLDSEIKAIKDILSSMPVPQVSEITAKTALVTIYQPSNLSVDVCNGRELDGEGQNQVKPWTIDSSSLSFKLFLAERDSEPGSFLEVYTPWSEEFKASTAGSPPSAPDMIRLVKAMTHALQLSWSPVEPVQQKSLSSESHNGKMEPLLYRLEMLDEVLSPLDENFVTVYSGKSCEHLVTNLRRSTCYKFRVAVANSDGLSKFSDVIACQTLADKPSQPKNLQATALDMQGKPSRHSIGSVSVCWDSPDDCGGQNITCYCLEMLLPVYRMRGFKLKKRKVDHLTADNLSLWPSVSCEAQPVYFTSKSQDSTLPLLGRFLEIASVARTNHKPKRSHSLSPRASSDHESNFSCKKSKHTNRISAEYAAFEDTEPEKQMIEHVWCVVYLGLGSQVIVDGLKSGLELSFRVRAANESHTKDFVGLLRESIWGKVSSQLVWQLAPVVPGPFIASPRLTVEGKEIEELGTFHMRTAREKQKSEVCLHWSPPPEDGGAPIILYEVQHATSGDWTGKKSPQTQSSGSSSQLSSPEHRGNLSKKKKHVPEEQLALLYRGAELECLVSFQESSSIPRASSKHGVFPLRPGRTHSFRVRAKNSLGWTNWSDWKEFIVSYQNPFPLP
ncbi:Fibronectin type III domain-containing protein 3B [Cichlidogyrus casuarinus]|uniref:Fibronectin type III domain-containing protein 3B n=1 Tax=Cichlidogyrus casuarinus TaxID=1844966 RepID=A0ABD2QI84_9PLAT